MHDFAVLISWVIRSSLYKARKLYAHRRMILKFTILIDILSVKIPLRLTNMGYSSCRFNKLQKVKSFQLTIYGVNSAYRKIRNLSHKNCSTALL